ncbi:MAG: hypothetical protein U9N04_00660 [Patescibacteria group bacterium]|nr:hypothetical protein [Patescibacteria group bacterium]
MKRHKKVRNSWWLDVNPEKIKRRIWNRYILLFWHRLYIRKDEFHPSLDIDMSAMLEMNEKEKEEYLTDLVRRRKVAHRRDS